MDILNIGYEIIDNLLPVIFMAGTGILYMAGNDSHLTELAVILSRCCCTLLLIAYITYVYFYLKHPTRTSRNVISLIIKFVVLLILLIALAMALWKIII